jgi:spectinomycin phosphotransferase
MYKSMEQMLYSEYGIQARSLQEIPSGWSAAAWKVHSDCGNYFLKVYDKHKPSTKSWVARIHSYMPVVLWLHENTELRSKMTAPILTRDGDYKKEDTAFLYMVFPYIEGSTICSEKLKLSQIHEIAQIVSELHCYGTEIPVPTISLKETFDVSFCMNLADRLGNIHNSVNLKETLSPYIDTLTQRIKALQKIAVLLQNSKMRYSLCHTDIHGWNMIQSENLILIDWEGLKLAPVEADLFSFSETFFYDYAWEDFITVYCARHKDYRINSEAMRFYRLRRRLEDIYEFVERILFDNLAQDDIDRTLGYLKRECELLHNSRI